MPSLAARLVSAPPGGFADNLLWPQHTAAVAFTDPPRRATNVVVRILETVSLKAGTHPYHELGRFLGHFADGRFVVDAVIAAPADRSRPMHVLLAAGEGAGKRSFAGLVPRPSDVTHHSLRLRIDADGLETFHGKHRLHVGSVGATFVFWEDSQKDGHSFEGYAHKLARHVPAEKLVQGAPAKGSWKFSKKASVVRQIEAFHAKTGRRAAELHVIGHANNGFELKSKEEAELLSRHALEDVKIVWHGCLGCSFFIEQRRKAFFETMPAATIYGHDILVQSGMPWAFIRVRSEGEVDIPTVTAEVLPRGYVEDWASTETDKGLTKTVQHDACESDVKAIVRGELEARQRKRQQR